MRRSSSLSCPGRLSAAWPLLLALAGCGDPPAMPPTLYCEQVDPAPFDQLEMGGVGADGEEFVPYREGAAVRSIFGPQGGQMLPVRLRVTGARPPVCLEQLTTVEDPGGQVIAVDASPLSTFPDPQGGRATQTRFLVFGGFLMSGTPVLVSVTAGGVKQRLMVWIDRRATDGGMDATGGGEDAGPGGDGGVPPDLGMDCR